MAGFICASPSMQRVVDQVQRLQGNDLTVLITGESGTGKELIARAIHAGSLRNAATFLPYNCTTTTRELADSQLFGHRRGAFTGAVNDQPGLIRAAAGGTLFLDEVGDLPFDVQPKLLRFLEQSEILPVGDTRPQSVDVRVLAATNADLEQRVAEGKFREDLYYRLSVIRIHIPPLRQRRDEIPHLAHVLPARVGRSARQTRRPAERRGPQPVRVLLVARQRPPAAQRGAARRGPRHSGQHRRPRPAVARPDRRGPGDRRSGSAWTAAPSLRPGQSLAALVDEVERGLIEATLARSGGNIAESARTLGLTRRGLYLKLKRLGIDAADAAS